MTPFYITILLAMLPTAYAICMDTGDETCCYCNDSWLCGVLSCPLTSTTVIQRTTTTTSELTETTNTISISVIPDHSMTMSTEYSTVTVTPHHGQTFSTFTIVGFCITGLLGLSAILWFIHCMFWYAMRCFDSHEQPTCRTELFNLLSTPLARFSDLNVSESTV